MTELTPLTYADLDWNELWRNARIQKGWQSRGAKDWDKKSIAFAARNKNSPYISLLLSHLPLTSSMTVLDIGCGPGTLALPMARRCSAITAIDFSAGMLDIVRDQARENDLDNITAIQCAWEDDWQACGIRPHDITIASRSMSVEDLSAAITKLDRYATKYVFIVDRISPTPFDPDAFQAVGRPFDSGPDYIYTVNMLYSMGIYPDITVLQLEKELYFEDQQHALQSYSWMLKDLTSAEEERLKAYLADKARPHHGGGLVIERKPPRWALISWAKGEDYPQEQDRTIPSIEVV